MTVTTTTGAPTEALTRWRAALRACKRHFVSATLFSLALNLLYLAPSIFMIQVYDRVIPSRGVETLVLLGFALIAALGTLSMLDWARARLLTRAGVSLDQQLAPDVMRNMLADATGGARRTQALREFDTLRQTISGPAPLAAMDLPWAVIFIIVIGLIHPTIALIALVGMAVIFILSFANDRAVRAPIGRANGAALVSYALLEQSTASSDAVRGLGLREALVSKHMRERASATDLQAQASLMSSYFQSAIRFTRLLLQSLLLGWGAYLAIEGDITPGAMFAASILGARAIQPIEQLTTAWRSIVQAKASYESLKGILESTPAPKPMALPAPRGRIALERVFVARPGGGDPILAGISMALSPGEILGVVGPSGSGKTTLARVAIGAVKADSGAARIDGAEISQWEPDQLGRHIGYVPQSLQLFAGTVIDNISRFQIFAGEDRDEIAKKAVAAAQAAGAHDLILGLSKGYDTEIGRNGEGLSGGQAQRVALARALYGEPSLLILDEPNSFLDNEGEQALLRAIAGVKARGGSALIIAHRGAIMTQCDRLVVIVGGKVEMSGPRDEILAKLAENAQRAAGPQVVGAVGGRP